MSDLLKDLARAKAAFQLRAIKTALGVPAQTCRKCGGQMGPGIAMGQTYTGSPDDLGGDVVTMSAGGPGEVIRVRKCRDCGWSVGGADD